MKNLTLTSDQKNQVVSVFDSLAARWEDEHEYEKPIEYAAAFAKQLPFVKKVHVNTMGSVIAFVFFTECGKHGVLLDGAGIKLIQYGEGV